MPVGVHLSRAMHFGAARKCVRPVSCQVGTGRLYCHRESARRGETVSPPRIGDSDGAGGFRSGDRAKPRRKVQLLVNRREERSRVIRLAL